MLLMFLTRIQRLLLFVLTSGLTVKSFNNCPLYCKCSITDTFKHVKCTNQNLINVELDVPKNVQWLELSHNSIHQLPDNIFYNLDLTRIIILDVKNNVIKSVGQKAFYGLKYIQLIDLSGNHLYKIDPYTFENIPYLTHLVLSSNPLRIIQPHKPFAVSQSLKVLEISNCRISYFPISAFTELPSLKFLNISNNHLLSLSEQFVEIFENLEELDIKNTGMKCDDNLKHLMAWSVARKTHILGIPCQTNDKEPKKSEKIIMHIDQIDNNYDISESPDGYDSGECTCIPKDNNDLQENIETTSSKPDSSFFFVTTKNDCRSMLWLTFLTGNVVGAAISITSVLFWLYCCKLCFKRRNNRNIPYSTQYTNMVPCETPPPSYNELFY